MKQLILIACQLLWLGFLPCHAGTNTVYFLVESHFPSQPPPWTNYQDSFVLPLDRPEHIAYARQLLNEPNNPNLRRGITAAFAVGKDGINRNYLALGAPEWNWHIVRFLNFNDAYLDDAIATSLEWQANHWGYLTIGSAMFASYHLAAELGPAFCVTLRSEGDQILVQWNGPPALEFMPYSFTLEWTPRLNPPNWQPLPGVAWPLQTNQWSLPKTNAPPAFYRVKAQL